MSTDPQQPTTFTPPDAPADERDINVTIINILPFDQQVDEFMKGCEDLPQEVLTTVKTQLVNMLRYNFELALHQAVECNAATQRFFARKMGKAAAAKPFDAAKMAEVHRFQNCVEALTEATFLLAKVAQTRFDTNLGIMRQTFSPENIDLNTGEPTGPDVTKEALLPSVHPGNDTRN